MSDQGQNLKREADFFSATNNALNRQIAWSALPQFAKRMLENFDLVGDVVKHFGGRRELRALTLACGDMTGEYSVLEKIGAAHITAYDISEGQREKFYAKYDRKVAVDYRIADVNRVEIPPQSFDIAYMSQSLHHITEVEWLLGQIAKSLRPGGVFLLNDYIGEPFLQRTARQRELSSRIWARLPARLRRNHQGAVLTTPHIPPKANLSPFEAIRSDAIEGALAANFIALKEFKFAGLLYPLINGFAQNYNSEDTLLLDTLWEVDQYMIEQGAIEPNFIRGIYAPQTS